MKKQGFTLAEILIVLGIVGVVAAITLPTFVSSNQEKTNETKRSTSVSAIENALTTMLAKEAETTLDETTWADDNYSLTRLSDFLKLEENDDIFKLKNGTVVTFTAGDGNLDDSIGTIVLDVNGAEGKPNREGRDIFTYEVIDTGELKYVGEGEQ